MDPPPAPRVVPGLAPLKLGAVAPPLAPLKLSMTPTDLDLDLYIRLCMNTCFYIGITCSERIDPPPAFRVVPGFVPPELGLTRSIYPSMCIPIHPYLDLYIDIYMGITCSERMDPPPTFRVVPGLAPLKVGTVAPPYLYPSVSISIHLFESIHPNIYRHHLQGTHRPSARAKGVAGLRPA